VLTNAVGNLLFFRFWAWHSINESLDVTGELMVAVFEK
jgi:hypothetical protein